MTKDTYYFSHDYNARNDRKIASLVRDYKSSGYGIFWATCEMMHEEGGELEFDEMTFGCIAKDLNELPEFIKEVLEKCVFYKLFTQKNEAERSTASSTTKQTVLLRSNRIDRNLINKKEAKKAKVESGRLGGIKSGESRRNKVNVEAKRSTALSNEANKIKGNEIKENNIYKEFSWESDKKSFLNAGNWIFKFCTDKNIAVELFDQKANEFISDIELREDFKPLKELRNHFINWYNNKNGKIKSINGNGRELSDYEKKIEEQRLVAKNKKYD